MTTRRTLLLSAACGLVACGPKPAPKHDLAMPESPEGTGQVDADFGLRLALLEGHLRVGRELVLAGQKDNALPHFGHPIRELYGDLRPVIEVRRGAQFEGDLVRLESLAVLEGNTPAFRAAFDATIAKAEAARATIPREVWASDAYALRLVADIAGVAASEYHNALVAGRVDSLVEYHDTRGFMFYAADLLTARDSTDPRIAQAARIVGELKTMVEPLTPPDPPRATDAQFQAKADALRALLG